MTSAANGNVRGEKLATSGVFSLDGEDFDLDKNVWLIGDDHGALIIDAAHDATAINRAIAGRDVLAIVCTHAHNDQVNAAPALRAMTGARSCCTQPTVSYGT